MKKHICPATWQFFIRHVLTWNPPCWHQALQIDASSGRSHCRQRITRNSLVAQCFSHTFSFRDVVMCRLLGDNALLWLLYESQKMTTSKFHAPFGILCLPRKLRHECHRFDHQVAAMSAMSAPLHEPSRWTASTFSKALQIESLVSFFLLFIAHVDFICCK